MSIADVKSKIQKSVKDSTEDNGTVAVTCSRDGYTSGEVVSGQVVFTASQCAEVKRIVITIEGTDLSKDKQVFLSEEKVIGEAPAKTGELREQSFPFDISLPNDLPSSSEPEFKKTPIKVGTGVVYIRKGLIYRLVAKVELVGDKIVIGRKKISVKTANDCAESAQTEKKSKIKVKVDKDIYYPGDSIKVEVDLGGIDPVHINKLRVSLVEATYAKMPKLGKWIGQETPLLKDHTLCKMSTDQSKYVATIIIPTTLKFGSYMSEDWDITAAIQPAHLIKVAGPKAKDPLMKVLDTVLGNKPPTGQVTVPIKVTSAEGAKGDMANVAMGGFASMLKI